MKNEKSCGTIIFNDNKVLVIKQKNKVIGFPKGHMEIGETEEETAIRETKEETNIDVEIDKNFKFVTNYIVGNNVNKDVIYFIAKPLNFDLKFPKSEIDWVRWIDINDVENVLLYDNIKQLWHDVLIKLGYK